jgi:hypothetical protein
VLHPRRRASYLGDVDYSNRERGVGLDDDRRTKAMPTTCSTMVWCLLNCSASHCPGEIQPVDFIEEEALGLVIAQDKLDKLR